MPVLRSMKSPIGPPVGQVLVAIFFGPDLLRRHCVCLVAPLARAAQVQPVWPDRTLLCVGSVACLSGWCENQPAGFGARMSSLGHSCLPATGRGSRFDLKLIPGGTCVCHGSASIVTDWLSFGTSFSRASTLRSVIWSKFTTYDLLKNDISAVWRCCAGFGCEAQDAELK